MKQFTYREIVKRYIELAQTGKIGPESIQPIYHQLGITDPNTLPNDQEARNRLMAEFDKLG